uniref:Transposase n=1 Tax=Syphacia muris TaxID=451379 RepID=A0A0N5AA54_9BILA
KQALTEAAFGQPRTAARLIPDTGSLASLAADGEDQTISNQADLQ